MKLNFSRKEIFGRTECFCSSDSVNKDGVSLLACLLMDNGGLPESNTVPWLEEGLARTDAVVSGALTSSTWDREDWGATITIDAVEIHSLHKDDYTEVISSLSFRIALSTWNAFIQSKAESEVVREIFL